MVTLDWGLRPQTRILTITLQSIICFTTTVLFLSVAYVMLSVIFEVELMVCYVLLQMFKLKGSNEEMSEQMEALKREKKSLEG